VVAFSSYFRRLFSKGTSEGRKLVWNWITHVHLRTNLKAELTVVVVVVMMLLLLAVVMWCILWGRFLLTHRILRTKWRRRIECKIGYIQGGRVPCIAPPITVRNRRLFYDDEFGLRETY